MFNAVFRERESEYRERFITAQALPYQALR